MTPETKKLSVIGGIVVVVLLFVTYMISSASPSSAPASETLLIRPDSQKITAKGAKVTIVEFGDFQCPACGVAHPYVKDVLSKNKGKVNFVFRNFPLPQHQNAPVSAEAAEAAGEQGKFWEMYDKLYESQAEWGESANPMDFLKKYAKDMGLDVNKFTKSVEAKKFQGIIDQDTADATALVVNSTPTFYVNGVKVEESYTGLAAAVQAALKNTK